jgi:hypothetical protein
VRPDEEIAEPVVTVLGEGDAQLGVQRAFRMLLFPAQGRELASLDQQGEIANRDRLKSEAGLPGVDKEAPLA